MAMFDDPKKDLQQLEKQLIEEEEWFRQELESAKLLLGDAAPQKKPAPKASVPGQTSAPKAPGTKPKPVPKEAPVQKNPRVRNYANGYGEDLEIAEKPKSNRFLVILAICETLGIVGIVAYWLLFIFG